MLEIEIESESLHLDSYCSSLSQRSRPCRVLKGENVKQMLLKLKSYRSRGCVICANINTFRNRIIQIINYMPFLLDCMIARHKYPSFSLFHKKSCNEIAVRTKFFAPPSPPPLKSFQSQIFDAGNFLC